MSLVLYTSIYEFHFRAALDIEDLAAFLNALPLGFKFRETSDNLIIDPERGPGVYSLHLKQHPSEERPIPKTLANYYIRFSGRASEGDIRLIAISTAHSLRRELETEVWLVEGMGHNRRAEKFVA